MFTTFLIGTAIASAIVLLLLLIQPKQKATGGQLPYVGMTLAFLLAVLAIVGGLAVTG